MISLLSPILTTVPDTPQNLLFPRDCVQNVIQFTTRTTLSMFMVCRSWYHAVDRYVLLADTFYYLPEMFKDVMIRRQKTPACISSTFVSTLLDDVRWGYVSVMMLKGLKSLCEVGSFPVSLKSLCLREVNQITDAGLAHVPALTSLISLDHSHCSLITDAGLA
eukprot:PhF_6_TR40550/c3_g1_i2/m.60780